MANRMVAGSTTLRFPTWRHSNPDWQKHRKSWASIHLHMFRSIMLNLLHLRLCTYWSNNRNPSLVLLLTSNPINFSGAVIFAAIPGLFMLWMLWRSGYIRGGGSGSGMSPFDFGKAKVITALDVSSKVHHPTIHHIHPTHTRLYTMQNNRAL